MDWHKRYVQQAIWTKELRAYLFGRAGMPTARRVLEAGCGTGAVLSGLDSPAAACGIDLDRDSLLEAHRHAPAAVLACGDVLSLPFPADVFDITFCHFLLLWVREPLQALREMKRVTRPGGSILALAEPDYTGRVDRPEALAPLGRWQAEALKRQGADPALGGRLAQLFQQTGIRIIESGTLKTGQACMPAPEDRDLEWAVLEADLAGYIPPEEMHRLKGLDERAWETGERVLSVPTHWAFGVSG